MPSKKHHVPDNMLGGHDKRPNPHKAKKPTLEQLEHRKKIARQKRQEEIHRAMPHGIQILKRQMIESKKALKTLIEEYGEHKVIIQELSELDKRKKLLSKAGLRTQKQLNSHQALVNRIKELKLVKGRMVQYEKRILSMSSVLEKQSSKK